MKLLPLITTLFILLTTTSPLLSQNINMPVSGSQNACSGHFSDSEGELLTGTGRCLNNDLRVYTLCSTSAATKVRLSFLLFDLENGADFLEIFDGNSVAAPSLGIFTGTNGPGLIEASSTNTSGCLTFRFTSNASVRSGGWYAHISCAVPCQTITTSLLSSAPVSAADGIIKICQGQNVNFIGSAVFSTGGAGATYSWSFGDGGTATGLNVNHVFATGGMYVVNMTATATNGCKNKTFFNKKVQVSTTPTITTSATPSTLCTNQQSTLNASASTNSYTLDCTPPVNGTTFLPDGTGVSYSSSIVTSCYAPGATVTSANDILNICVNMEHSWIGDIDVRFICPNGQTMIIKPFPDGGNRYIGAPLDDPATTPGTGSTYCFTPAATTLWVNGATSSMGTPPGPSIVPGTYRPAQPFSNLIGCPLNGSWTIQVTDNAGADNGYMFNWDFELAAALSATPPFEPTIVTRGWASAASLYPLSLAQANVYPPNLGSACYTYSVTDDFGCVYNQPQCINVNCIALPVGLVAFGAKVNTDGPKVMLNWITETETNNDFFQVERSADGKAWEVIITIDGAGNSYSELRYNTTDNNPLDGISYYRLRQVDMDGGSRISDVDLVDIEKDISDKLVIYPNPANDYLSIEGNATDLRTFVFLNTLGQNIKAIVPITQESDLKIKLDLTTLAKGTYTIKTSTETYLVVRR